MSWYLLPFFTSKELFCICVVMEVTLTLRTRNIWSFISYWGRAQPPSSSCFYRVSAIMDFCPQEKLFSGSHLSPASIPVWVQRETSVRSGETRRDDAIVLVWEPAGSSSRKNSYFTLTCRKKKTDVQVQMLSGKNFLLFVGGSGLKLIIQRTKIMASSSITSWQIDGEAMETVKDYFLGL